MRLSSALSLAPQTTHAHSGAVTQSSTQIACDGSGAQVDRHGQRRSQCIQLSQGRPQGSRRRATRNARARSGRATALRSCYSAPVVNPGWRRVRHATRVNSTPEARHRAASGLVAVSVDAGVRTCSAQRTSMLESESCSGTPVVAAVAPSTAMQNGTREEQRRAARNTGSFEEQRRGRLRAAAHLSSTHARTAQIRVRVRTRARTVLERCSGLPAGGVDVAEVEAEGSHARAATVRAASRRARAAASAATLTERAWACSTTAQADVQTGVAKSFEEVGSGSSGSHDDMRRAAVGVDADRGIGLNKVGVNAGCVGERPLGGSVWMALDTAAARAVSTPAARHRDAGSHDDRTVRRRQGVVVVAASHDVLKRPLTSRGDDTGQGSRRGRKRMTRSGGVESYQLHDARQRVHTIAAGSWRVSFIPEVELHTRRQLQHQRSQLGQLRRVDQTAIAA
ncbi:hypothetical protein K438DRAFT_1784030 [Mycena galopus ATCC 62051]|nr:hypothetical protein K438DRAFT_1784030 [Mycena galopus ATCC 62051]